MANSKRYYPARPDPRGSAAPDCCTCAERRECPRAAEGSFCTRWHSREADPRGEDPNRQWETGEDTEN